MMAHSRARSIGWSWQAGFSGILSDDKRGMGEHGRCGDGAEERRKRKGRMSVGVQATESPQEVDSGCRLGMSSAARPDPDGTSTGPAMRPLRTRTGRSGRRAFDVSGRSVSAVGLQDRRQGRQIRQMPRGPARTEKGDWTDHGSRRGIGIFIGNLPGRVILPHAVRSRCGSLRPEVLSVLAAFLLRSRGAGKFPGRGGRVSGLPRVLRVTSPSPSASPPPSTRRVQP